MRIKYVSYDFANLAIHAPPKTILSPKRLKTLTTAPRQHQNLPRQGREYRQMIADSPISEITTLASSRSLRGFRPSKKAIFRKRTQLAVENKRPHYDTTTSDPVSLLALHKHVFPFEPSKSLKTKDLHRGHRGLSRNCVATASAPKPMQENAQRSAMPARLRVVSRRADKYRVRCALPSSSILIRFDQWLALGASR